MYAFVVQEIFAVEEGNYTGHVFAGLAGLELGRYAEAKQHYKTAIASQPAEQLAWKVIHACTYTCTLVRKQGKCGHPKQSVIFNKEKKSCLGWDSNMRPPAFYIGRGSFRYVCHT